MKRTHLLLLLALTLAILAALPGQAYTRPAAATPSGAASFTLSRQPGTFEIHIFDVEQGDSQLIIFPSGYSLLIDVSEPSWTTGKNAALIAEMIRALTGGSYVDVAVLTHLHLDHIGYSGYGGFWALLEKEGLTLGQVIDRDAGQWVDGSGGGAADGACDLEREIEWHNAGTVSNTARRWLCYATDPANTAIYNARELAQVGSTTQIDPPDAGARVEVIEADAQEVLMADGLTPVPGDHMADPLPPSENDYSIALKISFGEIDYATAGDTDGEYATSQWGYTYNDVESVIAPRFGPVELLHVNHHGSSHSSNATYVATLDPEVSLISCGRNTYGHPDQAVLDRLLATSTVYLTNFCDAARDYGAAVIADGDIVIRSQDGLTYQVLVPQRAFLPMVVRP